MEIPIIFPDRQIGKSKLSFRDKVEFLLNIPRLRFNQTRQFVKYCVVGTSGVLVNIGFYTAFTRLFEIPMEVASPIAIELSILTNFILIYLLEEHSTFGSWSKKLVQFHLVGSVGAAFNYIALLVLVKIFGLWDIAANLIGIAGGIVINYGIISCLNSKIYPSEKT